MESAQNVVWLVVGAFVVTVPLVAIARRTGIAYPIFLVLGGLALGFVPGMPRVDLDPNLVLVIFLPPLLYWEALTAPTDVMLANGRWIASLSIGLVIATTAFVAIVAHATIPGLAWAMAFALGAIVAPTDELAAAPVLERLRMPRHLVAVVEGESLLNDASSLILYAAAVGAVVTGAFEAGPALLHFAIASLGGIAVGIVVARIAIFTWPRVRDIELQGTISFTLPYLTYLAASRFGLSGVLAVVACGIAASRETPFILIPAARMRATGFYESAVFFSNAILFLLLGLQLHAAGSAVLQKYSWPFVATAAFAINATLIAVRFAWFLLLEYVPWFGGEGKYSEPSVRRAIVASWSGLRGAVSLAAALAIPVATASGAPVAQRELVIFLTFSVILVTLVGGGLTLPAVVRALRIPSDDDEERGESRAALAAMAAAARLRLSELEDAGRIEPGDGALLRKAFHSSRWMPGADIDDAGRRRFSAQRDVLRAERLALRRLREKGELDNRVLRRLVRALDLAEEGLSPEHAPELQ